MLCALTIALGVGVGSARGTAQLAIVLENPDFTTYAVDHQGRAYGVVRQADGSAPNARLYTSLDEGASWQPRFDFPSSARITSVFSVTSDDTLFAMVADGSYRIYRSTDSGQTWTNVFTFPAGYQLLTSHSLTDNGHYIYMGSYNVLDAGDHVNWVWRSEDSGLTWTVVRETTTHRHIHFVQTDPWTGYVYVGYGDTSAQSAIERSVDSGATWETLCSGAQCMAVDIAFDPKGFAVFGQDHVWSADSIVRVDLATGVTTPIAPLPGPSHSAFRLNDAFWIIGETHEPEGSVFDPNDTNLHLFASDDGTATFADVLQRPYPDTTHSDRAMVQFAYPDGHFPVRISGFGTIVARFLNPVPTISTVDPESAPATGESLTVDITGTGFVPGSVVLWNGAPQPTSYVGVSHLSAVVPGDEFVSAVDATITVENPAPGGGRSSSVAFSIAAASPRSLTGPEIQGEAREGETAVCEAGEWAGDPSTFTWRWFRDGAPIDAAETASYVLDRTDVGRPVRCEVTGWNDLGSAVATSSAIVPLPSNPRVGTGGDDVLLGTILADDIRGLSGDDVLVGYDGDDILRGGRGHDRLRSGAGTDTVVGGRGRDRLSGGAGQDTIWGGVGADIIFALDGSRDFISCGPGLDSIYGADRSDVIAADCERVRFGFA